MYQSGTSWVLAAWRACRSDHSTLWGFHNLHWSKGNGALACAQERLSACLIVPYLIVRRSNVPKLWYNLLCGLAGCTISFLFVSERSYSWAGCTISLFLYTDCVSTVRAATLGQADCLPAGLSIRLVHPRGETNRRAPTNEATGKNFWFT